MAVGVDDTKRVAVASGVFNSVGIGEVVIIVDMEASAVGEKATTRFGFGVMVGTGDESTACNVPIRS